MEKEIKYKDSIYLIRSGEGDFKYWISCFKDGKKIMEINISFEDEMDFRTVFKDSLILKEIEFIERLILNS
ncbi:MAG: hypothetical protein WCG14_07430 [Chlamydiia bacterium]